MERCEFCKAHKYERNFPKPCDGMVDSKKAGEILGISGQSVGKEITNGYISPTFNCYKTYKGGVRITLDEVYRYKNEVRPNFKCDICGKPLSKRWMAYGHCLCSKHYTQYAYHGKFKDTIPQSMRDHNQYEILGETTKVYTHTYDGKRSGEFLIDTEDLEKVLKYKWNFGSTGHLVAARDKETHKYIGLRLGPYLMNLSEDDIKEGAYVDHISRDPSDNRKENLRVCSPHQNCFNKRLLDSNTSGYSGVSYEKRNDRYKAYIDFNQRVDLVWRKDIKEAIYARYIAEAILYREFCNIENHILKFKDSYCLKKKSKQEIKRSVINKLAAKHLIDDISLAYDLIAQDEAQMESLLRSKNLGPNKSSLKSPNFIIQPNI